MAGTLSPFVKFHELDNNGDPAAGYQLFTYEAGTSTKATTYTDVDLSTPNANPIILDSAGRATIYLSPGNSYKYVLASPTDTDPPASPIWTQDNISAIPLSAADVDVQATAGEDLSAGECVYLSKGEGGRTVGRWYLATSTLGYASAVASAIGFAAGDISTGEDGTVKMAGRAGGQSGLSTGSMYYVGSTGGTITTNPSGYRRRLGVADSSTTLILSQWLPELPVLASWTSTVGNVGAGEDTLATTTIPAGTLAADNMSIKVLFWGHTADNANSKTIKLRAIEGSNNNVILTMEPLADEDGDWALGVMIMRTGAAVARAMGQGICGPESDSTTKSVQEVSQPTLTWANAVEIRLTGEATDDNDITMECGSAVLVYA